MASVPSSLSGRKPSHSPSLISRSTTKPRTSKAKRFTQSLTRSLSRRRRSSSPPAPLQQEPIQQELVHRPRLNQRIKATISTNLTKLKFKAAKMNVFPLAKRDGPPQDKVVIDLVTDDEDEEEENLYDATPAPRSPLGSRQNSVIDNGLAAPFQPPYPRLQHELNAYIAPIVQPNDPVLNPDAIWGDFLLDDIDDDALMHELRRRGDDLDPGQEAAPFDQFAPAAPIPLDQDDATGSGSMHACIAEISILLPDICPEHVSELYNTVSKSSERLIQYILDKVENGTPYPTIKDKQKTLKRKRLVDEDEALIKKFSAVDRIIPAENRGTKSFVEKILGSEFVRTPMIFINATLEGTGHRLFPAYRVLEEAERTFDPQNPPYNKIKTARKPDRDTKKFKEIESLMAEFTTSGEVDKVEVLKELQASRKLRGKAEAKRQAERDAELAEQENTARAEAEGTMGECGCCFCDYPLNRMVHCDGNTFHWFCRDCARRNAEEEIGKSKFELICMSTDKCTAGFTLDQRAQFLDEKTKVALERNETEYVLREAGFENLASCPFCPFAMEYPPIEVNHEFHCKSLDCEKVSCRLCKLESHIPQSCEEHAKENGLSIRRQIEEAMSAALIRKCNKCSTPFVKEEGCNKMTCTRNGCYNIQCYVCSKSCGYNHFNDAARGGKVGNCPLFESVEQRHQGEVSKAEKQAMEKILAEHPEYTEEDLKVKMSENVTKDDDARKAKDPRVLDPLRPMHFLAQLGGGAVNRAPLNFGPGNAWYAYQELQAQRQVQQAQQAYQEHRAQQHVNPPWHLFQGGNGFIFPPPNILDPPVENIPANNGNEKARKEMDRLEMARIRRRRFNQLREDLYEEGPQMLQQNIQGHQFAGQEARPNALDRILFLPRSGHAENVEGHGILGLNQDPILQRLLSEGIIPHAMNPRRPEIPGAAGIEDGAEAVAPPKLNREWSFYAEQLVGDARRDVLARARRMNEEEGETMKKSKARSNDFAEDE